MNKEQSDAQFLQWIDSRYLADLNLDQIRFDRLIRLAHKGVKAEKLKEALEDIAGRKTDENKYRWGLSDYTNESRPYVTVARAALKDFNDE
mgnify:CR=1 FL=1